MDWKKKLMLATGAFVSMPAAVTAHPDFTTALGLRRSGALRRRRASVPFEYDPEQDQSIRVRVRVPYNKARRRVHSTALRRCQSYRAVATLIKLDGTFLKVETGEFSAGGGTTFQFDMTDMYEPTTVTARVEVEPTDLDSCLSTAPLTSFTVKGAGGRDYLPSRDLDAVLFKSSPDIIKPPIDIIK